ncbi:hypothetical protein STEG23_036927, partial [Scotinomys teguina]
SGEIHGKIVSWFQLVQCSRLDPNHQMNQSLCTGYHKKKLPIEELKISPLFVRRAIAAAMAIRFIIITLIWFAIFIT